jgi:hypothetical protein
MAVIAICWVHSRRFASSSNLEALGRGGRKVSGIMFGVMPGIVPGIVYGMIALPNVIGIVEPTLTPFGLLGPACGARGSSGGFLSTPLPF